MSSTLEGRYQQLQEQVKAVQDCLAQVGHHLESAAATPLGTWDSLLKHAAAHSEATRQPGREAGKRLQAWLEQSANKAPAPFDYADLDGEIARHEDEAAKLEGLAADAVVAAAQSVREVELVLLNALKIRTQAIELARNREVF